MNGLSGLYPSRCESRWEMEPDRMRRLSGASPQRHYVRTHATRFTGMINPHGPKVGYGKKQLWKPKPPAKPAFNPYVPKRPPFGKLSLPLPAPSPVFRPGLTRAGLGMLARIAKPWPLTAAMLLLDLYPWSRDQPEGYDMIGNGWSLWCDNGLGPLQKFRGAQANPGLACGTGFQVPNGNYGDDIYHWATDRWFAFGRSQFGGIRMRLDQQWVRGDSPPPSIWLPARPVMPGGPHNPVTPWPHLDPGQLPIFRPVPPGLPIPYPMIPHRAPTPYTPPGTGPVPYPPNKPFVRGRYIPAYAVPSFNVEVSPRTQRTNPRNVVVRGNPGRHNRVKPRTGTREKKVIMNVAGASSLGRVLGMLGETGDWIDVFFDSLSDDVKRGHWYDNRIEKLALILQNLDALKPGSLLANALSNQLEDTAFGKLGKISGKAMRAAWNNLGSYARLQTGPADTPVGPNVNNGWVDQLDTWLGENVYNPTIGNTTWKGTF